MRIKNNIVKTLLGVALMVASCSTQTPATTPSAPEPGQPVPLPVVCDSILAVMHSVPLDIQLPEGFLHQVTARFDAGTGIFSFNEGEYSLTPTSCGPLEVSFVTPSERGELAEGRISAQVYDSLSIALKIYPGKYDVNNDMIVDCEWDVEGFAQSPDLHPIVIDLNVLGESEEYPFRYEFETNHNDSGKFSASMPIQVAPSLYNNVQSVTIHIRKEDWFHIKSVTVNDKPFSKEYYDVVYLPSETNNIQEL